MNVCFVIKLNRRTIWLAKAHQCPTTALVRNHFEWKSNVEIGDWQCAICSVQCAQYFKIERPKMRFAMRLPLVWRLLLGLNCLLFACYSSVTDTCCHHSKLIKNASMTVANDYWKWMVSTTIMVYTASLWSLVLSFFIDAAIWVAWSTKWQQQKCTKITNKTRDQVKKHALFIAIKSQKQSIIVWWFWTKDLENSRKNIKFTPSTANWLPIAFEHTKKRIEEHCSWFGEVNPQVSFHIQWHWIFSRTRQFALN